MFFKIENYNFLKNLLFFKNKYSNTIENIPIKSNEFFKNKKIDSYFASKEKSFNFFIYFKNIFTKNKNQTDKILKKNRLLDEIVVENCEILPKNFLFSCVNSFLKIESIEAKENFQTKIVSYLNLWYQKK
jgi:hypothetical protein